MFSKGRETQARTFSNYVMHYLKEKCAFSIFPLLNFMFCLSFHFRLGKTLRLVCIQIINLDLSLEGERLICYVLEMPFDFPFFFFKGREMLVLSRLSL